METIAEDTTVPWRWKCTHMLIEENVDPQRQKKRSKTTLAAKAAADSILS